MDVHHHSHSARKKWTNYFWEFLMLFLAVFCGFLAEYQLEHKIEKDREHQFMKSLVEDLNSDIKMLDANVIDRGKRIEMIDSLVLLLEMPDREQHVNNIYFFGRSISPPFNIFPNDGTIQQLKSSGNLRLIRKKEISNKIMAYDQKLRNVLFEMGDEIQIRAEYRQLAVKVFNSTVFHEIAKNYILSRPTDNSKLFNEDPALINQLIGSAQYIRRVNLAQLQKSIELSSQAKELKENITREYSL